VKQSLPKLRVEADWPFDRSRILVERDCMAYLGTLLPPGSVPVVRFSDEESFAFGMTCAPPDGVLWKEALLGGVVENAAAERAGSLLGRIHSAAAGDEWARRRFIDQTVLIQGRVDPYHLTAAQANPDLAPIIHAEVERLLGTQLMLVLGDYSPKNTFVYADRVLVLDFEVAHWGDPAFDVAFCLTHLSLKACKFPDRAASYLGAARLFWAAYIGAVPDDHGRTEAAAVRELGCLLLARIDGKSKIEYITDEPTQAFVRDLAAGVLTGTETRLLPALDWIEQRVADQARIVQWRS
jgi:5-methylthioribose kinase